MSRKRLAVQTITSQESLFEELSHLYAEMEEAYNRIAKEIGLTCEGCPDNCCTSYFQHHTYIEWAYLWKGIQSCPQEMQRIMVARAGEHVKESQISLAQGLRPRIMCPLNLMMINLLLNGLALFV